MTFHLHRVILLLSFLIICLKNIESKKFYYENGAVPSLSKAFVINLDKRPNRMKWMDEQLNHLGIPYQRFSAINWYNGTNLIKMEEQRQRLHPLTKMNLTLVQQQLSEKHNFALNWGSAGCWQSHLQIYLQIIQGNYTNLPGPFLILEDDVHLSPRILDVLSYDYLYHYLPYDWEMIFLDHLDLLCHENEPHWKRPKDHHPDRQYCMIKFTYTTGAYIIRNPSVAAKLVKSGNSDHIQVADWFFNYNFNSRYIKAYAILHRAARQTDKFPTDIQFSDGSTQKVETDILSIIKS